jgi:hypothetical protein
VTDLPVSSGDGEGDEGPPSWAEHAAGLRGEQRALAMCRALLSDDSAVLDAAIEEEFELMTAAGDSGEHGELERYTVALATVAVRFGAQVHGQ